MIPISAINKTPYLRVQRNFPENDMKELCVQLDKGYIDTANAINVRTIGIFPTNKPAITGESWYLTARKRQSLRQVYSISSTNLTPEHMIDDFGEVTFSKIYGTFTDGTDWYPLPWVDVTNVNNQITIRLDPTNINVVEGAGSPPIIVTGMVILEWIAQA